MGVAAEVNCKPTGAIFHPHVLYLPVFESGTELDK